MGERFWRHGLARDVSIHQALMPRIAKLHHDVAPARQEAPVSQKRHDEVVDLLVSVDFANCDKAMILKRLDDPGSSRAGNRLGHGGTLSVERPGTNGGKRGREPGDGDRRRR
jgi:hypothetical protein